MKRLMVLKFATLFVALFAWSTLHAQTPPDVPVADGAAPADVSDLPSHMILLDATTGTILKEKNSGEKMFPSSMSKLMTEYMVFDELKKGTLQLTDTFTVSENAWRIQGSKMFVPIGEQVGVEDLIRGISIQSGNDACVVVAEGLAGSEAAFADRMNAKAKELGMTDSNFVNASGWPDENHYTTAADLAILGKALIRDFPEFYHYFSEREFTYNGIRQYNRNPLLGRLGVDGLKTGHTEIAGYGIVLTAKEPVTERRLVLVVNGLKSMKEREQVGEYLLTWGFRNFENITLAKKDQPIIEANIFLGKADKVALTVREDVLVTLPKTEREKVSIKATYQGPLQAPITAGAEVGTLVISLPNGSKQEVPLVAAAAVEKKGIFARIPDVIGSWF
ncbi:MAG: D-alanyl-D-alanine carboxypeptidase [Alphaproteobacteria bacterium]|nr:D-alanyl-D-alanine carboxypeptidase [Alphaproteobacteria bacterium]